jgi:hypothetical protein
VRLTDFAVALVALMVVAGCGAEQAPDPAAAPAPPRSPAAEDDVDCGTFDLGQGEELPDHAGRCLAEAVNAKRAARLRVSEPTVEGDPIVSTYTAYRGGGIELVLDSRQDGFGPKAVTTQTCTAVSFSAGRVEASGCSDPKPKG